MIGELFTDMDSKRVGEVGEVKWTLWEDEEEELAKIKWQPPSVDSGVDKHTAGGGHTKHDSFVESELELKKGSSGALKLDTSDVVLVCTSSLMHSISGSFPSTASNVSVKEFTEELQVRCNNFIVYINDVLYIHMQCRVGKCKGVVLCMLMC